MGWKSCWNIGRRRFKGVIQNACPGAGACGGMYTANTMASAIEALGIGPFLSILPILPWQRKAAGCDKCWFCFKNYWKNDIKSLLAISSLENLFWKNPLRLLTLLGGSTNAVLHFLAIAKAADVWVYIGWFQRISDTTSILADLKPSGKYLMEDLHRAGALHPAVMKFMLENGMLRWLFNHNWKDRCRDRANVPSFKEGQEK